MKITPQNAEAFVKKFGNEVNSILVYGPDVGGVKQLGEMAAKRIVDNIQDAFLVCNLESERIIDEPSILIDELSAILMFGGRKLVQIKNTDGSKELTEIIEETLSRLSKNILENCFLLITGGELDAKNSLRKLYESENNLAAIALYQDDEKAILPKILRLLSERKIKAEAGVVEYIAETCKGDSMILNNQIEKIDLYLGEDRNLSFEDVLILSGNSSESSLQEICNAYFSNDKLKLQILLHKAVDENIAEIAVLRTINSYLEKLHSCLDQINAGLSLDEAVAGMRPPIFYKQVPVFKSHVMGLQRQGYKKIFKIYNLIYLAEQKTKETGLEPDLILKRALTV